MKHEVDEAWWFLRRLRVTMDFALDERKFHEGPADVEKLMES